MDIKKYSRKIISRITSIATKGTPPPTVNYWNSQLNALLCYLAPEHFSTKNVLLLPAVRSAVGMMGSRLGNLDLVVEEKINDKWERVSSEDEEARIVSDFWTPYESKTKAIRMLTKSLMLHGFSGIEVERKRYQLNKLTVLNPELLEKENIGNGKVKYIYNNNSMRREIERKNLIWIDFEPPFDRIETVPPLLSIWNFIKIGISASFFAAGYFARGAVGHLFYTQDSVIGSSKISKVMWDDEDEMRNEGRRSIVLPPGIDVKSISSNIKDTDLSTIILMATKAVGQVFNIPPILLSDDTRSTYRNSDQAGLWFARHTLTDTANSIAWEISSTVWPSGNRRCRFDLAEITAEPRLERLRGHQVAIFSGIMSQEEGRILEGMSLDVKGPGSDQLLRTPSIPALLNPSEISEEKSNMNNE